MPGVARLKDGSLLRNLAAEGLSAEAIAAVEIAAGHFTDDVLGRVTSVGDGHAWTPVGASPTSR
ncbi:hypothetical protein [Streptomyces sp. BK340]|uniref:hypothetical protein n=1 Tax=Streptomyces sp. BK340 TaxID=2572903 RepID=UPI00119E1430|nr:hypothetical protein [Streptomyces sp. BK340]TVZ91576.1 hypothetical protein FB157_1106 [Streptomyces sp. BK340]